MGLKEKEKKKEVAGTLYWKHSEDQLCVSWRMKNERATENDQRKWRLQVSWRKAVLLLDFKLQSQALYNGVTS